MQGRQTEGKTSKEMIFVFLCGRVTSRFINWFGW